MFLSKANMVAVDMASKDKDGGALTGLHIAADGSTVGTDTHCMLAVEPVKDELVHFPNPGPMAAVPAAGVTADAELVQKTLKNLPTGKGSDLMQYAALTEPVAGDGSVELSTTGIKLAHRVSAPPLMGSYPDWRQGLRKARQVATRGRIAVDRRKLMALLKVMDAACPDPGGDNTVFIEFGGEQDPMVLRAVNYTTGQHAVGLVGWQNTYGRWLDDDEWEAGLMRSDDAPTAKGKRVR